MRKLLFLLILFVSCPSVFADGAKFREVFVLGKSTVSNVPDATEIYKYVREPNVVMTKKGTIIIMAGPHHVRGKNDRAHQDMICCISKDEGKTWSLKRIADEGMNSILPTCLVYDEIKDRVILICNIIFNDPDAPKGQKKPCEQFVMFSEDEGKTWTKPKAILPKTGGICVFGGGQGFQLKKGPHKGRLIVPGGVGRSSLFYSDDHGETWDIIKNIGPGRKEGTGVELPDGSLLINNRKSGYGIQMVRSKDHGKTWTKPEMVLPDVWASVNNSMLSIKDGKKDAIVYLGPLGPENADKYTLEKQEKELKRGVEDSKQSARQNGGLFISYDGGKTWKGKVVTPGWIFGYNALFQYPNGDIGVVFEGCKKGEKPWAKVKKDHNTGAALGIYMLRVNLKWLKK